MKVLFATMLIAFAGLMACSQEAAHFSAPEWKTNLEQEKEALILDVRTLDEFSAGHLADARHQDILAEGFLDGLKDLDKSVPVYVYCRSGGRSARAQAMLQEAGFKKVINLDGGITAWKEAGFPTVKP